jgi:hypothetical protein
MYEVVQSVHEAQGMKQTILRREVCVVFLVEPIDGSTLRK